MSATESDAFGRCHWCGNMTDSAGCLSVSCSPRAAPSAAPGEAASDEQCADHLDRLAALRLDSIGADAWQEAFARGASALRAAPAPVRVSEAWRDVWKYLAHRDDDEFECREHRDGPGTCDCGLTPAVDRLTAALAAQEARDA